MKASLSKVNKLLNFSNKRIQTLQTHFFGGGVPSQNSGIRVCIFGANSGIAPVIGAKLLDCGTFTNMVHRHILDVEIPWHEKRLNKKSNPYRGNPLTAANYNYTNDSLYNLRSHGDVGLRYFTYAPDVTNEWEVENAIKDCDVIINCIGNNPVLRHMEDFEEANIIIPRVIAKVCARLKNNPVKRLIHFSANGVDPDSYNKGLRTKWIGEQEVREIFPEATIIRPTEILHSKMTNSFMG